MNTKKLSFNDLPAAVSKILELLLSGESEHTAIPEIRQRIAALEKKFDYLITALSPDRPVLDRQAVMRILKIRPKTLNELAESGVLQYRVEGSKKLFYEDCVVKYYMAQPAWASAVSEPVASESIPDAEVSINDDQHLTIKGASMIVGRSTAAIYQLVSNERIPFHRNNKNIYFIAGELRQWLQSNPPRKRRAK